MYVDRETALPNRLALLAQLDSSVALILIHVSVSEARAVEMFGTTSPLHRAIVTALREVVPETALIARFSDDVYAVHGVPGRGKRLAAGAV